MVINSLKIMNKNTKGFNRSGWFDQHPVVAVCALTAFVALIIIVVLFVDYKPLGNSNNPIGPTLLHSK